MDGVQGPCSMLTFLAHRIYQNRVVSYIVLIYLHRCHSIKSLEYHSMGIEMWLNTHFSREPNNGSEAGFGFEALSLSLTSKNRFSRPWCEGGVQQQSSSRKYS